MLKYTSFVLLYNLFSLLRTFLHHKNATMKNIVYILCAFVQWYL